MNKKAIIVIILVFLAAIGLGGYYYQTHKISSSVTAPATPTSSKSTATTSTTKTAPKTTYLTIKEWGVRFKLSKGIEDAVYTYKDNNNLFLSTKLLDSKHGCKNTESILLQRGKKGDKIGPATTVNELLKYNPEALVGGNDGYYYLFTTDKSSCRVGDDDNQDTSLYHAVRGAFNVAVKSIHKVSR